MVQTRNKAVSLMLESERKGRNGDTMRFRAEASEYRKTDPKTDLESVDSPHPKQALIADPGHQSLTFHDHFI
jgi:hypothetical protein